MQLIGCLIVCLHIALYMLQYLRLYTATLLHTYLFISKMDFLGIGNAGYIHDLL